MNLSPGARLGPYELLAPLGASSRVARYRARDTRLMREVAVEFLSASSSADPELTKQIEREARAAAGVHHPNLLAIYDVGTVDDTGYVVTELLEGETLRGRLDRGAPPLRKAVDYALQLARGLAAAHDGQIVHGALTPENLLLTCGGQLKILGLGLASFSAGLGGPAEGVAAAVSATEAAEGLGPIGYLAPEQARGHSFDHRSDLFSFGTILYEMLSGRRAFARPTEAETLQAILNDDAPEFGRLPVAIPPGLEVVVRRCLEKRPEDRFQSAHDLAFAIDAVSGISNPAIAPEAPVQRPARLRTLLLLLLVPLLLVSGAFVFGRQTGAAQERRAEQSAIPSFQQLTFRRGMIGQARFTPDGQTVVLGAIWHESPHDLFSLQPGNPELRALGVGGGLQSISSRGELAILHGGRDTPTLATIPLAGGTPRDVLDDTGAADWSPDGKTLAAVHWLGSQGIARIEFPIGKVLYEMTAWHNAIRVSPRGNLVAFIEVPTMTLTERSVVVLDSAGHKVAVSDRRMDLNALAWSPQGDEVWYMAQEIGRGTVLRALSLTGRDRLVARMDGMVALHDIAKDGRLLLERVTLRQVVAGKVAGATQERDLSALSQSWAAALSRDGQTVIISESSEGGGLKRAVYMRRTDGSPAVRLGDGAAADLSPDGKWVIAIQPTDPRVVLLPTGAGQPRPVPIDPINQVGFAWWFPDGRRILLTAEQPGRRFYEVPLDGGKPRPATPEGTFAFHQDRSPISPDGRWVLAYSFDKGHVMCPLGGGEPRRLPGWVPGTHAIGWGADSRSIYLRELGPPHKTYRVDLATGKRTFWRTFWPSDGVGVNASGGIHFTADETTYVYTYYRELGELYLVSGFR